MRKILLAAASVIFSVLAVQFPAQAQGAPGISPSLKKMLRGLPIAGIKDDPRP